MLALTIREKNGDERQLIIDQEDVTIGRAAGSDIVLPRSNISKRHARLVDKHDKVVIVDLRSTNGTYVNGRRITAPELLTFDDKVYIGDFVIRLTRPAEQHASQRLAGPYTAGPPTGGSSLEPRGARLPTQAADVSPAARFTDSEPPPPPMAEVYEPPPVAPPPMDVPDDDASTRAIDIAMIEEIDARFASRGAPPAPPAAYAPPPPPVAPPDEVPKSIRSTVEFGGSPPSSPVKPPAPPPRVTRQADPDLVATQAVAVVTPAQVAEARAPKESVRQPQSTRESAVHTAPPAEDHATHDDAYDALPGAPVAEWEEVGPSAEDDAWTAWNLAIGLLVQRVETADVDDRSADETQHLLESVLEAAIGNGEISPDIDRAALTEDALGELLSIGPLAELESDPTVSLVFLNGPRAIFVSRQDGAIESTGRVFATSRSYRRALRILTSGTGIAVGEADSAAVGLQEGRLNDGSLLRIVEPGGGADPVAVWRRTRADSPTLDTLEGAGIVDAAQRQAIESAAARGESILICGAAGEAREALTVAIAAAYGVERRVVRVGDGNGHALPHFNAVSLFPSALVGASEICALEPELVVFEPLDGRIVHDWVETSLVAGCPVLAVTAEADVQRALRRLALAVELHGGANAGLGERFVREAVGFTVSLTRDAHGDARVLRAAAVSAP